MAQQTRLGAYGGPRQPYGSFAGKVESIPQRGHITRLGCYGGPRAPYGSFSGKAEAAGITSTGIAPKMLIKMGRGLR